MAAFCSRKDAGRDRGRSDASSEHRTGKSDCEIMSPSAGKKKRRRKEACLASDQRQTGSRQKARDDTDDGRRLDSRCSAHLCHHSQGKLSSRRSAGSCAQLSSSEPCEELGSGSGRHRSLSSSRRPKKSCEFQMQARESLWPRTDLHARERVIAGQSSARAAQLVEFALGMSFPTGHAEVSNGELLDSVALIRELIHFVSVVFGNARPQSSNGARRPHR